MTRATKYSGVEWIGQIPERWHLTRIAGLYNLRNTKVSDKDFPALSVTNKGILPQLETAAKTNAGDNRKLVCIGDFAINSRSDRRGSCGISPYNGSVSLINLVLTPRSKTIPKYFDWLFHTVQFADEFYRWGHGIVDDLWSTGWEEMKKILVPLPPLPEQQAIADYLDDKCAQINNITATINEQIEVLKQYKKSVITEAITKGLDPNAPMKDSGVEWIGQIPEHWKVVRLKYLGTCNNGLTYKPSDLVEPNEGVIVLRSSNIKEGKLVFNDNVYVDESIAINSMLKEGDILICSRNGSRELIGKNTVIPKGLKAGFGAFMMVYRTNSYNYIHKILNSHIFSYYLGTFFTSTINQLTTKNFENMKIVYTPYESEQQAIANYLDDKCAQIDAIIANKQAQLETLAAYKKSLIYEYVTGKKSVPGFEEA